MCHIGYIPALSQGGPFKIKANVHACVLNPKSAEMNYQKLPTPDVECQIQSALPNTAAVPMIPPTAWTWRRERSKRESVEG